MLCLTCGVQLSDPRDFDFCSIACEEEFDRTHAELFEDGDDLQPDESMDGDHESALESVYGPEDDGRYDDDPSPYDGTYSEE